MAKHLDAANNRSPSFQVFVNGVPVLFKKWNIMDRTTGSLVESMVLDEEQPLFVLKKQCRRQ